MNLYNEFNRNDLEPDIPKRIQGLERQRQAQSKSTDTLVCPVAAP